MDRKLAALVLATVVLTSVGGVAAAGVFDARQAGNATADATVTVSATGTATAEPDQAVVYLTVTERASTAGNATERLAENVSQLRDGLDTDNLSVTSVETVDYQVFQEEDETGTVTYVARHSFAVTTGDPNEGGSVIDVAVDSGADEIRGVQFELSEERRREVRTDAIDAAVTDAQVQAEALADSADLTLAEVRSISTGGGPGVPVTLEAADASTRIDASPVSVSVTVQVTYNATGG